MTWGSAIFRRAGSRTCSRWLLGAALVAAEFAGVRVSASTPQDGSVRAIQPQPAKPAARELRTDRPDATESPYTVDTGHWQLEMDFARNTQERRDGVRTTGWEVAPFNLRLGLNADWETGIFVSPYVRETEELRGGPGASQSGFGDVTFRAKWNLWGNDRGASAFGLIADVKLPTAARRIGNGKTEWDLLLPVAWELGEGWELGAMTGMGWLLRDDGVRRAAWINTATLGRELTASVSAYIEFTAQTFNAPPVTTCDVGVAWKLNPDLQLDAGMNVGLSRAADDGQFFVGISRRY